MPPSPWGPPWPNVAATGCSPWPSTTPGSRWRAGGRGSAGAPPCNRPPPAAARWNPSLLAAALALFGYGPEDLDPALPPAIVHAGADHLLLALRRREALAAMHYPMAAGAELMREAGLLTILLVWAEGPRLFHSRNAFAVGGVYEDPATGAATAALAAYLQTLGWPHGGAITVVQGEAMGCRSLLEAAIPPESGGSIRVSGTVRRIGGP